MNAIAERGSSVATERRHPSQMARNVVSNWGAYLFSVAVNILLAPFVVSHLGSAGYGVWTLTVSLTGYLGLLDLGVRSAVTRYVAKFQTESNHDESSRIASSALFFFTIAAAVAVCASLVLAFSVIEHLRVPEEYRSATRLVVLLAGMNVALSLLGGVFGGIVAGLRRLDLVSTVEVLNMGSRSLVIALALSAGGGVVSLALIQVAFCLFETIVMAWLSFRLYPQLRVRLSNLDRQHLALVFSYSLYSFLLHIAIRVIFYTDVLVIGAFLPVTFVTFFAIAGNLVNATRPLPAGIRTTLAPLASSLESANDRQELQRVTLTAARYCSFIALPVHAIFMLRGRSLISLWMGREYADVSGEVLWILTVGVMFAAGNSAVASMMFGSGRHKPVALLAISEAVLNLGLSVGLVRSIGLVGVAWGTSLPSLAVSWLFWPAYARRVFGIPIRSYVLNTWGRPGAAIVPFALLSYLTERFWPAPNLLVFLAQVVAVLPLALLGFWCVCLSGSQRHGYREGLRRFMIRGSGRDDPSERREKL